MPEVGLFDTHEPYPAKNVVIVGALCRCSHSYSGQKVNPVHEVSELTLNASFSTYLTLGSQFPSLHVGMVTGQALSSLY